MPRSALTRNPATFILLLLALMGFLIPSAADAQGVSREQLLDYMEQVIDDTDVDQQTD